jgi:DNA-directed RNA polymerase subunit K/omega
VVTRPADTNAFEFVVVSALRAAQLMKGCTPRVPAGYKHIVTAQLEVAAGKVAKIIEPPKTEAL